MNSISPRIDVSFILIAADAEWRFKAPGSFAMKTQRQYECWPAAVDNWRTQRANDDPT
jgi:hypothetical protein